MKLTTIKLFYYDLTLDWRFTIKGEIGKEYDAFSNNYYFTALNPSYSPMHVFSSLVVPAPYRICEVELSGEMPHGFNIDNEIGSFSNNISTYDSMFIEAPHIKIIRELSMMDIFDMQKSWVKRHNIKKPLISENSINTITEINAWASDVDDSKIVYNDRKFGVSEIADTDSMSRFAITSDEESLSISKRNESLAYTNGHIAYNSGKSSFALNNRGYGGLAITTNENSVALSVGKCSMSEAQGKNSVAIANGEESQARGVKGSVLVFIMRDNDDAITETKSVIVDGETIKENTCYTLYNGEVMEWSAYKELKPKKHS
jgi:hypothetical protein